MLTTRSRHLLHLIIATLVAAVTLVACGGAASTPAPTPVPAETPEQRVKGFFATFSQAINDPAIGEEARKAEWIEKLAGYAPPDEKEQARAELTEAMAEFTGLDVGELAGQPGIDVRMEMSFTITETKLVAESGDSATVEVVGGTISMKPVGADVEKLGETAAMLTQEVPISEFFSDTNGGNSQIQLRRVDGVWYIIDALGGA